MTSNAKPQRARRGSLPIALVLIVLALVVALITQHAVAAQVGRFVAWLWVSVMDVVMRLVGAVFGGGG